MRGKTIILIVVIIAIMVIIIAYLNRQGKLDSLKTQLGIAQAQTNAINAQTAQQEACKKNWLCATTSLLGGVANVGSTFSLGNLFGGAGGGGNNT